MTVSLRLPSAIAWGSSNRRALTSSVFAFALLVVALAPAVNAADDSAAPARPRIGLVLGGGGARGAAHVGVLKVLEELRIPVDYVVGTSMGSIVGGLYASGMNSQQIEQILQAMDWNDVFEDYPSREQRSFHRKQDDRTYAFKVKPGFNHGKIQIPLAYIRGQKLDLVLSRLSLSAFEVKDFDHLPIPYRAVATDIETGKEVVLATGSLAQAIRASMAVPAAFDPVEINGRLLVDGGLANNVPVSVARDMGADVLIVVDVGSGLYSRDQITNALDVTGQLANFLFTLNTEQQLKTLGTRDVLIRPPLGDIGGGSFERAAEAIPIGERAARESTEALRRYSLSPEEYARYLASHNVPQANAPVIDFVRVDNHSRLGDAVIAERISAEPGQRLDLDRLEKDIGRVYGLRALPVGALRRCQRGRQDRPRDQRQREVLGSGLPATRNRFVERHERQQHIENRRPLHPHCDQYAQRRVALGRAVGRRASPFYGAIPASLILCPAISSTAQSATKPGS